jgi:hypothetical protein
MDEEAMDVGPMVVTRGLPMVVARMVNVVTDDLLMVALCALLVIGQALDHELVKPELTGLQPVGSITPVADSKE